jgi:flavin-dependent dehydrogenase
VVIETDVAVVGAGIAGVSVAKAAQSATNRNPLAASAGITALSA